MLLVALNPYPAWTGLTSPFLEIGNQGKGHHVFFPGLSPTTPPYNRYTERNTLFGLLEVECVGLSLCFPLPFLLSHTTLLPPKGGGLFPIKLPLHLDKPY